jgi:hypothetical protein
MLNLASKPWLGHLKEGGGGEIVTLFTYLSQKGLHDFSKEGQTYVIHGASKSDVKFYSKSLP